MNKGKQKAKELISKFDISNPFHLADILNINVNFMDIGNLKGYVTKQYNIECIVINSDLSEYEQEFTCFHELGHILLNHNHNSVFLSTKTFLNVNKFENEANMFATHMILSKYNKDELQELTIEQISNMIGINKIHLGMYFDYV